MKITDTLYILDVSPLREEALFTKWYDRVDDDRKKKTDAMKPLGGKILSLGAGILLYEAMKDAGIKDYEVESGEKGKPYLKGHSDVFFNISHSGERVVLALSDKEVGVDVEKEEHFKDSLINYVFNEGDKELAKELAKDLSEETGGQTSPDISLSMDECYTRLWTVKESVMKHSGLGISLEPKKIEIYTDDSDSDSKLGKGKMPTRILHARSGKYDCSGLQLFSLAEEGYQITICTLNSEMPKVVHVKLT